MSKQTFLQLIEEARNTLLGLNVSAFGQKSVVRNHGLVVTVLNARKYRKTDADHTLDVERQVITSLKQLHKQIEAVLEASTTAQEASSAYQIVEATIRFVVNPLQEGVDKRYKLWPEFENQKQMYQALLAQAKNKSVSLPLTDSDLD